MSMGKAHVLRSINARRIYDYIEEHGPCLPSEIGEAFPDLDRTKRGQVVSNLREFGLVRKVPYGSVYRWEVIR